MHKLQGKIRANCEKYRAATKKFQNCFPIRLIQLSAVGEVQSCRDRLCRVRQFQITERLRRIRLP